MANFFPETPEEITCQRTLFLRASRYIFSHTSTQILTELKTQNNELNIIEASKIEKHNYLKISVDNSDTTDKIMRQGILMFKLHIPGSNISTKRPTVKVTQCFNCFSYDHHTDRCKEQKSLKCTNCFGPHKYVNCKVSKETISCFHCKENHHTFAFACKIHKDLINQLKNHMNEPRSYANVTKNCDLFERRQSAMYPVRRKALLPTPVSMAPQPSSPLPPPSYTLSPPPFDASVPPPHLPHPPPPFPLHSETANLMIKVMSQTVGVIQFAIQMKLKNRIHS